MQMMVDLFGSTPSINMDTTCEPLDEPVDERVLVDPNSAVDASLPVDTSSGGLLPIGRSDFMPPIKFFAKRMKEIADGLRKLMKAPAKPVKVKEPKVPKEPAVKVKTLTAEQIAHRHKRLLGSVIRTYQRTGRPHEIFEALVPILMKPENSLVVTPALLGHDDETAAAVGDGAEGGNDLPVADPEEATEMAVVADDEIGGGVDGHPYLLSWKSFIKDCKASLSFSCDDERVKELAMEIDAKYKHFISNPEVSGNEVYRC
jgi:hypothetical protein